MKGFMLRLLCFVTLLMGCKQNEAFDLMEEIEAFEIADILLSEILPDPKKDGVEFVEIFNNSNKVIDLSSLQLATMSTSGKRSKLHSISQSSLMIYPYTYKLLSSDSEKVKTHYPIQNPLSFHSMSTFPTLTNSRGAVLLLRNDRVIDSLYYDISMHDAFIKDPKGVSLERVSFKKETNSTGNFISASASAQYATPGYENSQFEHELKKPSVFLSSKIFSPDQGEQLTIHFQLPFDNMTNIFIYNQLGMKVHTLANNHRLGTNDRILWTGQGDCGRQLPIGVYHLYIEIYDSKGNLIRYKESCVLAGKIAI